MSMSLTSDSSGSSNSAMAADPEESQYESLDELRKRESFPMHAFDENENEGSCQDRATSIDDDENNDMDDDENNDTDEPNTEIKEVLRNGKAAEVNDETIAKIVQQEVEEFIHEKEALQCVDAELTRSAQSQPQHRQLALSEALPDLPLEIGDHVYQWRSFAGIPGVFQHHGIVMDIRRDEEGEMELQIADFSCILREPSNEKPCTDCPEITQTQSVDMITGSEESRRKSFSVHPHGVMRVYNSGKGDPKWHKVHYKANVWKTTLWRSGTCTCVESDPPAKVLARAYFLLEHPEILPSYHIFRSNCECVSLWCKTGLWSTLQASSLLSLTAAGQLKSTATLAAYAASTQVTVQTVTPAAGIMGWLGYTTTQVQQVSLLSTQPHLIPLLAAYGVVTAGGPTFVLWKARRYWEQTTQKLEEAFWANAMDDPDTFARSMLHWSERHKAFER